MAGLVIVDAGELDTWFNRMINSVPEIRYQTVLQSIAQYLSQ